MSDTISLMEIWGIMKAYIPAKDHADAAEHFITHLDNSGLIDFQYVDDSDVFGVCNVFDAVLKDYLHTNYEEEDDIFEDYE